MAHEGFEHFLIVLFKMCVMAREKDNRPKADNSSRKVVLTVIAKNGSKLSRASNSSRTYFLFQRRLTLIKVLESRHMSPRQGGLGQIWDTINRVCITPDMHLIVLIKVSI